MDFKSIILFYIIPMLIFMAAEIIAACRPVKDGAEKLPGLLFIVIIVLPFTVATGYTLKGIVEIFTYIKLALVPFLFCCAGLISGKKIGKRLFKK